VTQCLSGDCKSAPVLLASAQFSDGSQSSQCVQTLKSGSCLGYVCSSDLDAGAPYVSAGSMTLAGGKLSSALPFDAANDGTYVIDDTRLDLDPAETATVTASGAQVPAFMQSVVAPPALVLTKPKPDSSGTYQISTSADLAVTWTGGQAGNTATLTGYTAGTTYSFVCTWDASVGQGTVPAAILTQLAGQAYSAIEWLQDTTVKIDAGAYSITETVGVGGQQSASFN
jgi:hypothetical protein